MTTVEYVSAAANVLARRGDSGRGAKILAWGNDSGPGTHLAAMQAGSWTPFGRKDQMNRLKTAVVTVLLAANVGMLPAVVTAEPQGRRDRYEDRRDRQEDKRDRREDKRDRREDKRDRREDRYDARNTYWDPARYYRTDNRRYPPRRLGRNDTVYRGSDNRYYCKRDDGTTGLIIGGVAGGVLGNVVAPGGHKVLGTLIGAGAGALLGKVIDDGDIVCR